VEHSFTRRLPNRGRSATVYKRGDRVYRAVEGEMVKVRSMLKTLGRVFVVGLVTALPFFVTYALVFWVISGIEGVVSQPFIAFVPERFRFTGMGLAATIVIILITGAVINVYAAQRILGFIDRLMGRIPVAKMIYGSTKDVVHLFSRDKKSFNRVALVTVPGSNYKMVGLVTRDSFDGALWLPGDMVSVYIPISYQLGGYMMLIPRDELQEIDMSVEDAIRLVLTAGVSTEGGRNGIGEIPIAGSIKGQPVVAGIPLPVAAVTKETSAK
jgi:uncharacterized membrane protein